MPKRSARAKKRPRTIGGKAPKLRPKDVIAGVIKKRGKSSVKGGDRITLLRDTDGDGQTDLQTTFIDGLDAPYGLAFVDGSVSLSTAGDPAWYPAPLNRPLAIGDRVWADEGLAREPS